MDNQSSKDVLGTYPWDCLPHLLPSALAHVQINGGAVFPTRDRELYLGRAISSSCVDGSRIGHRKWVKGEGEGGGEGEKIYFFGDSSTCSTFY